MRKLFIISAGLMLALMVRAQYIPASQAGKPIEKPAMQQYWHQGNLLKHMTLSLTAGTTGVGIDVSAPVCEIAQVRVGYEIMIPFKKKMKAWFMANGEFSKRYDSKGNRIETPFDRIAESIYQQKHLEMENPVALQGKLTMNNFKLLVDLYPFEFNKNWHFTAGVYWGPSQFAKAEVSTSNATIKAMQEYNQKYDDAASGDDIKANGRLALCGGYYAEDVYEEGVVTHRKGEPYQIELTSDGTVKIQAESNSLKPYLGFGYGGRLLPKRKDVRVSFDCGLMLWGGTPAQVTQDGTNLSKTVESIPGSLGTRVERVSKLFAYPVLSVRFTKILF